MQVYEPPLDDYRFLFETFGYARVAKLPGHEDYDFETAMALLEQGGKFAKERLLPLNKVGDEVGLAFDPKSGTVTLPAGFREAYQEFCAQGYPALTHPTDHGGSGAPHLLAAVFNELFVSANKSFSMAPGLTHGLVDALAAHGSDDLKHRYLEKLVSGEWTGTMCLTEPQCGTDLGLLTTKAVPKPGDDGAFLLTGTKIWITFGEHDLTENIIHLVLARLPDAPEGIKGVSVFIVPKALDDGTRNGIVCGGLEHKMGIHASPTCVMNLEEATGYLVGEPHKGMRPMFTMMNAARLFVGIEGLALSEIAYQTALAFARDRRQGKSLDPKKHEDGQRADNILVHPDVRRMLLDVRSTNEGMRALTTWIGVQLDISLKSEDTEERERAGDLVALMTPIIKAFCTERGFACISESMQVTGGAGYTKDWSIEQYLRDERIALIYEGTNHIQALDLVGRKLAMQGGKLYRTWAVEVGTFLEEHEGSPHLGDLHGDLKRATDTLHEATMAVGMKGLEDPEEAAAVASHYLNLFGLVVVAHKWAEMLVAAGDRPGDLYERKRKLGRYYFKQILPEMDGLVRILGEGKRHIMDVDARLL